MPIFEYACEGCSHKFEKLVFNGTTEVECPKCGGLKLRKLFSVFSSTSGGGDGDFGGFPERSCGRCGSTERRCDI